MNVTFYILPGKVGLKFVTTPERDRFWSSIPAPVQPIAEKIGALTIRFHPEKLQTGGYSVSLETVVVETQQAQVAAPIPPANQGGLVDVSKVADPFARTGQNVVKALPGLVSVQSNIPQNEPIQARTEEPVAMPVMDGQAPQPVPAPPEPTPVAAPVTNADPEPTGIHKNSRKYREWLARQK